MSQVLIQNHLRAFFGFERPEIVLFRQAIVQFRLELPAILEALHLAVTLRSQCQAFFSLDNVLNDHAQRNGLRTITL